MENKDLQFCKLVKMARLKRNLTQKEFAEVLKVSPSTIKAWEKSIVLPNFDNLQNLIKYLRECDPVIARKIQEKFTEEKTLK